MNSKAKSDISSEIQKYSDEWVALSSDEKRVVSHDISFKKAFDKAAAMGEAHPVMMKVLSSAHAYVF